MLPEINPGLYIVLVQKNRPRWDILLVFQKSEPNICDQVAVDGESVLTFKKRPLVAEIENIKN